MFNETTKEFDLVIAESRLVSIGMKHGYINTRHVFIALLTIECLAKKYLLAVDCNSFFKEVEKYYPASSDLSEKDNIPLTVDLETIINLAFSYTEKSKKKRTSTIHLLLAMFSYDNIITELVQKTGIVFEDVAADNFPHPIKKQPPSIKFPAIKPIPKWYKFFMTKKWLENRVNEIHSQAYDLFELNEYGQCIKTCLAGQTFSAAYEPFKILIADAYLSSRNFIMAKSAFTALIREYPENRDYPISLAFLFEELGDYNAAAELLDKLLLKASNDEVALNNKGFNLFHFGKYFESIPYFEIAIEIKPDFAFPFDNLGFAKFKLGQIEVAFSLIDKSLTLDKGNAYAYMYKGKIFSALNNKPQAAENFNLALKYGFTKKYGDEVLKLLENLSLL